MKKDTLYLIIAALTLFIAWRTYRVNKKELEKVGNNPGGVPGDETPDDNNPTPDPDNNKPADPSQQDEDAKYLVKKVAYEKCPYCGAANAEVTRWYNKQGVEVKRAVACNNKSCPGPSSVRVITASQSSKIIQEI